MGRMAPLPGIGLLVSFGCLPENTPVQSLPRLLFLLLFLISSNSVFFSIFSTSVVMIMERLVN